MFFPSSNHRLLLWCFNRAVRVKETWLQIYLYDDNLDVETWWDLGLNDSTAIWFVQRYKGEIRLIDYYENAGEGLDHYVDVI